LKNFPPYLMTHLPVE
ncbi:hypothetical protein EC881467_4259, partial [Escherichia coli 88.1467]